MIQVNIWKFSRSSPVENQMCPVSLICFLYFPAEFFKFSFNLRCKIGWPPGHLDRVCYQKWNLLLQYLIITYYKYKNGHVNGNCHLIQNELNKSKRFVFWKKTNKSIHAPPYFKNASVKILASKEALFPSVW